MSRGIKATAGKTFGNLYLYGIFYGNISNLAQHVSSSQPGISHASDMVFPHISLGDGWFLLSDSAFAMRQQQPGSNA